MINKEDLKTKKLLRSVMLKMRDSQDPQQKEWHDEQISKKLVNFLEKQAPLKNVHCFLPMGSEVNITAVIEWLLSEGVTVVCPRSLPKRIMENLILESTSQLEEGIFGTRHPSGSLHFKGTYEIIIVPALAFDRSGNRLGYGAGYYDQFLEQHPEALKIGVGYPFQIVDEIPVETHDIRMDEIIF